MINKFYKKNGYYLKKFSNASLISKIEKIISKNFNNSTRYYSNLPISKFHKITVKCQNQLNKINIQKIFGKSESVFLKKQFRGNELLYSSFITLRAVRPIKNKNDLKEPLGWHRETFYGNKKHIKHAINFWMPVLNYSRNIGLQVIPESHLIDDRKIKRINMKTGYNKVKKFSDSHKLGFPYAPKKIISGVDLRKAKKVNVPKKSFMIFSQYLIHGNGQNFSNKIRFAINFSFLPKDKLGENKLIDKRKYNYKKNNSNKLYISV